MAADDDPSGKGEAEASKDVSENPEDVSENIARSVEEGRTLLDDIRRRNSAGGAEEADPDDGAGPRKFSFVRPLIYLVLAALAAAALYFFYDGGFLDDLMTESAPEPDRLAALRSDLNAANARTEALELRLSGLSEQIGAMARDLDQSNQSFDAALASISPEMVQDPEIAARIDVLRGEIDSLRNEILSIPVSVSEGNGETGAAIAAIELSRRLEERIGALEAASGATNSQPGSGAGLRYVAFGSLKASVATSLPFANELTAFRHVVADDDTLSGLAIELEGFSRAGIPSFPSLKSSFPVEVRAALTAIKAVDADASMIDKAWAEITSLVTIRRTGELEGEDAISVFARAEQRLAAGSLDDAIDELAFLPGDAADAFSFWLGDAKARLAAESILRMIEARLLNTALNAPAG